MGHGYKGDTGHYHSLSENIGSLIASFPFNENTGYFGEKGSGNDGKGGSNNKVREIASSDPQKTAKRFYDSAAHGGIEKELENGKGFLTVMKDGTVITFREVSHSSNGSPAVDINISSKNDSGKDDSGNIQTQKIHFVKE